MTRRILPSRTNRGKLPAHLQEEPSPVRKPRVITPQVQEDAERREMELKRKEEQIQNLKKYPFGRAVHYFFDLDSFPRAEGHISYAVDTANALGNNFSKDVNILNNFLIGDVLNRKLFGLPLNPRGELPMRKDNKCKNVCYGYLFEIEDKKYHYDRVICILRLILNKMKSGKSLAQFKTCQIFRKDVDLLNIFEESLSLEQRIQIVKQKLQGLQRRKNNNMVSWENDDQVYFYHALNQKLHNAVFQLKQHLSFQHLARILYSNQFPQNKEFENRTLYYFANVPAFSKEVGILSFPPSAVLHFAGSKNIFKMAGHIIAKKCESLGETHFYQAKVMVKKLFGLQLSLKSQKVQSYDSFLKIFRKTYEDVKKLRYSERAMNVSNHPYLDRFLRDNSLNFSQKTVITGQQYTLIMVFFWLCQTLIHLQPILDQLPNVLNIISSDYFPKICNSLVEAVGTPMTGMIFYTFQTLTQLFSKADPFTHLPLRISFQFQENSGIGLIHCEDVAMREQMTARNSPLNEQEAKCSPSKRFKPN